MRSSERQFRFSDLLRDLRRLVSPDFRLAAFDLVSLEFEEDELLLDDVIEHDHDSRVVPIFAGAGPRELRARIERHLRAQSTQQQSSSASDELAEALAELRRSLR